MMTERERAIARRMLEYAHKYAAQNQWDVENTPEENFRNQDFKDGIYEGVSRACQSIDVLLDDDYDLEGLVSDITGSDSPGRGGAKKKSVAVDVDATLAAYDGWEGVDSIGDPLPGAKAFVEALREKFQIIIWTTRCTRSVNNDYTTEELHDAVKRWLDRHEIPYDLIWIGQGKPVAKAFIDDHAIACRPQEDPGSYEAVLSLLECAESQERTE
jgi:hypothetical protein